MACGEEKEGMHGMGPHVTISPTNIIKSQVDFPFPVVQSKIARSWQMIYTYLFPNRLLKYPKYKISPRRDIFVQCFSN